MRALKIIKESETCYKLVCKLTMEDLPKIPSPLSETNLMQAKFTLNNIISHKGYWFRPCYEPEWRAREEVIEPPQREEETKGGIDGDTREAKNPKKPRHKILDSQADRI